MTQIRLSILAAAMLAMPAMALANSGAKHPEPIDWSFDGVLGKMDKPAVQRGLQVYKEVCSACHGMQRVPLRRLQDIGLSEAEVKAFAAEYSITDGPNDEGEMFERPGRPSDKFPSPYANDKAARAMNNGALPPDLSLMIKARPDGANYVHAVLTGYAEAPAYRCLEVLDSKCVKFEHATEVDVAVAEAAAKEAVSAKPTSEQTVGQVLRCSDIEPGEAKDANGKTVPVETCREMGKGMHYNPYFPGKQIAMPAPLSDDQVTYQDSTKATKDQEARDIVNFLQWAAEPEMESRKRMGIKVMLFLAVMTGFFYVTKKRIWSNLEH